MTIRDDLLAALEENRDKPISGQMIADRIGVSRNAVWKAINALKAEGYQIVSCTNKGYQLAADCDLLSAEGVRAYLDPSFNGLKIEAHRQVDSTNNQAKRLLASNPDQDMLIISESQSQGRGRQGREFFSPQFSGVYFSLVMQSKIGLPQDIPITAMAAVAIVKTIEELTGLKPLIKWVNDIFLDNKKICGILTEAVTDYERGSIESLIIGIGINVTTTDFPEGIDDIAGSLDAQGLNRNQLIAMIVTAIYDMCQALDNRDFWTFTALIVW